MNSPSKPKVPPLLTPPPPPPLDKSPSRTDQKNLRRNSLQQLRETVGNVVGAISHHHPNSKPKVMHNSSAESTTSNNEAASTSTLTSITSQISTKNSPSKKNLSTNIDRITKTIYSNNVDTRRIEHFKTPRKDETPRYDISKVRQEFPKNGLKLSDIENFVNECGGVEALKGLTTASVNEMYLLPMTKSLKSSYCEYLKKQKPTGSSVGIATVFISHAWNYLFLDVFEALRHHFKQDNDESILWFDLFSNNQHLVTDLDFTWWSHTFKSAIAQFGHTVLILSPWNDPLPLKRAWCLYEIYCSVESKSRFQVAMSLHEQNSFVKTIQTDFDSINRMLATIDAEKSEAYRVEDRDKIFDAVRQTVGFSYINAVVFEQLREWVIATTLTALENPENTPTELSLKCALGSLYSCQGRFEEAEPYLREAMEKRNLFYGDKHPLTLTSVQDLAECMENLERDDEANDLYAYALDRLSELPDASLVDVKTSMYNIAAYLCERGGRPEDAIPLLQRCIKVCKAKYGANHPDTLLATQNLANIYRDQGKYKDAELLLVGCIEPCKQVLGPDHPDTLICMDSLASVYKSQGRFKEAEKLFKVCLEKRSIKLGDYHPLTLQTVEHLGMVYQSLKMFDVAEPLLIKTLECRRLKFGNESSDTLMTIKTLAMFYEDKGLLDKAGEYYEEGYNLTKIHLGNAHPLTLSTQSGYSSFLYARGQMKLAETMCEECLNNKINALGVENPSTITSLKNLAVIYRAQGKLQLAKDKYKECMEMAENKLGKDDESVKLLTIQLAAMR